VEHAAFPRAAALAEALWTPRERRDWNSFVARLAPQFARYRATQLAAADSAFAVTIAARTQDYEHAQITLSSQEGGGTLRYTTDGSAPTPQSLTYTAPFGVSVPAQIAAVRFDGALPLGAVRSERIDRDTLSTRFGDELEICKPGLMLRLEDDAPRNAPRAVLNTDIFDPCWRWHGELPHGAVALRARVGQLPYNFQLWHDIKSVVERTTSLPDGELLVHGNACDGPVLARVSLAPAQREVALTTLDAAFDIPAGTSELCFQFATGKHDPLWSLERVQILSAAH
jgi:hexosaminidase